MLKNVVYPMITADSKEEHKLGKKAATICRRHQSGKPRQSFKSQAWETRPVYLNASESDEESGGLIDSTSGLTGLNVDDHLMSSPHPRPVVIAVACKRGGARDVDEDGVSGGDGKG